MRITRYQRMTVSMGPYETFQYGAEVSASHHDLGITDDALAALDAKQRDDTNENLRELVEDMLGRAVAQDVDDSADLTADKKSFILRALRGSK